MPTTTCDAGRCLQPGKWLTTCISLCVLALLLGSHYSIGTQYLGFTSVYLIASPCNALRLGQWQQLLAGSEYRKSKANLTRTKKNSS